MTAIDFPNSPAVNDTFTVGDRVWKWTGTTWDVVVTTQVVGPTGPTGPTGPSGTITVGTTTTGAAGSSASVSNSGTSTAAVFDFTIPKGDKGDTGATGAGGALGYYGAFHDSSGSQVATSTTVAYPITFDTTDESNGVSRGTPTSKIVFTNAGTYNLQFSIQFTNSDTTIHNVNVWFRKNGVNIADSNSQDSVPNSHGGVHGQMILSANIITTLAAGDYVELVWQPESTQCYIETLAAGSTPITPRSPGVIFTAQQVMYTQVGPAGPAGQGVPTGGTTGQILSKINSTDYNTQWITAPSGAPTSYYYYVNSELSLSNTTAQQKVFNSLTTGGVYLTTGVWQVFLGLVFLFSGTTTSHSQQIRLVGTGTTATVNSSGLIYVQSTAGPQTPGATTANSLYNPASGNFQFSYLDPTTNAVFIGTGNTASAVAVYLTGTIRVTSAGILVPDFCFATNAPGQTPRLGVGSYMQTTLLTTNTATNDSVGTWS